MTAQPEAITLDELAEAFDHEIDGCYVGGTEFAVNVFAYVRDHRPAPDPLVMPADEFAALRTVAEAAGEQPWTPEEIADFKARLEAALANPGPLRVLPSDHWKDRAEAAEARLAELENAVTWGTSCTSCARVLDSAYAETVRREAAEAKLAEIETHCRGHLERAGAERGSVCCPHLAEDILAITQPGSSEEPGDG